MPKKFFWLSSKISGSTKPRTRQLFSGPSHFLDRNGARIDREYLLENYPVRLPNGQKSSKYFDKNGNIDYAHLRRDMVRRTTFRNKRGETKKTKSGRTKHGVYRGLFNEFPEFAGMAVPFQAAINHLSNIAHRGLKVQSLRFQVELAHEAENIFKMSFIRKKFYSYGAPMWKPLSAYTRSQRRKFGTNPNQPLRDTRTLMNSIRVKESREGVKVFTDPSKFGTARRHKGFCYAGVHNDGIIGGYNPMNGTRTTVIPKRQFMGHSSYIEREGWQLAYVNLFEELFTPII